MHEQNDTWRPVAKSSLEYWKLFLTTFLLALATPYLLILLLRNPGKAAAISSAI